MRPVLTQRARAGASQGALSALVAIVAWWPPHLLMLQQGFWAAITAIAVFQPQRAAARGTARDQVVGAAIGGGVAAVVALLLGQSAAAFVLAVALAELGCWLVAVPSAARLAGITTAIVLLVPHGGSAGRVMVSRLSEVAWGVAVALAFAWADDRWRRQP